MDRTWWIEFYPSISQDLLNKAIDLASNYDNIITEEKKHYNPRKKLHLNPQAYTLAKLDPVPGWTCAQEAFAVVLNLMAYRI